jgi:hypothetical protein
LTSGELLRQGIDAARGGRRSDARAILMRVVETEPRNEIAWMWLTGVVDDLEDKIIACENVLTINPDNKRVKAYLGSLLQQNGAIARSPANESSVVVQHPSAPALSQTDRKPATPADLLSQAEQLESEGKIKKAIQTYEQLAAKTRDVREFDHIYRQIVRLEALKQERIRYVSPATSILRMTFTWSLLYLSFVFVQVGLSPFAHFSLLWLGFPIVVLGSFLLALSEVRTRHVIWEKIFLEEGSGSGFARTVVATAGWVFIVVPFALIILESLARLQNFQIPPQPFFK